MPGDEDSWGGHPRVRLAVVLLLGVLVLAACGSPHAFDQSLTKTQFQKTRILTLAGGTRLAYGSPDGHSVQVQWARAGATSWSRPVTAWREKNFFTHDIAVVKRGDTVALAPDYWREKVLDDDYPPDHTSQIICRPYQCDEGHSSTALSRTSMDGTGEFASFPLDLRDKVLLWQRGAGFKRARYEGLDPEATVSMLPDGSFAAGQGRVQAGYCRYDLLVTRVRATRFTRVAQSGPETGITKGRLPCSIAELRVGKDRATVDVEELQESIEFRRSVGSWTAVVPRSPLRSYPETDGRSTLSTQQISLDKNGIIAIGSPDLHRIMAQWQDPDTREWSAPHEVARAPRGTLCRTQSYERSHPGAVSVIACYPEDRPWRSLHPGSSPVAVAVGTTDGRTWSTVRLVKPQLELSNQVGDRILVRSARMSYVWRHGDTAFEPIRLPADPVHDGLTLTPDGRHVLRITGNSDPAATCRPEWAVTSVDARAWPKSREVPDLPQGFSRPDRCVAFSYYDGDSVAVNLDSTDASWTGTLAGDPAGWRLARVPD